MVYQNTNAIYRFKDGTSRYISKYPKFLLLFISFIFAYLLFYGNTYKPLHDFIVSMGYMGTFMAGIMFAYGFTAAPATAIFLILAQEQNILIAGLIGGLGALISDLLIFSFIRQSFSSEIKKLSREKIVRYLGSKTPNLLKKYAAPVLAGFIIASPLPDEIGVTMLAASKIIPLKVFSAVSYLLNTAGIYLILIIGRQF